MKDLIIIAIILLIVGGALIYIRDQKKKGAKCIGCSAGKTCPSKGNCPSEDDNKSKKAV